jgi:hypothetical protein
LQETSTRKVAVRSTHGDCLYRWGGNVRERAA